MTRLPYVSLSLFLFLLDRLTKWWASVSLQYGVPRPLIGQAIRLTRVHNEGGAFGIFPGGGVVFVIISSIVSFLLLAILLTMEIRSRLIRTGMSLVLAGALGNLMDRFLWGHVLDFFEIRGFPIFNVADACITMGACLILLSILRGGERHRSRRTADRV